MRSHRAVLLGSSLLMGCPAPAARPASPCTCAAPTIERCAPSASSGSIPPATAQVSGPVPTATRPIQSWASSGAAPFAPKGAIETDATPREALDATHPSQPAGTSPFNSSRLSKTEASLDFAFDLFRHVANPKENVVVAPESVRTALTMAYLGATGAAENEMRAVLRLGAKAEHDDQVSYVASVSDGWQRVAGGEHRPSGEMKVNIVNRMWAESTLPVLPEYSAHLRARFGADLSRVDFLHASDTSRRTINRFISEQTGSLIPELLSQGDVRSDTRLVLTNAVYFFGKWTTPFDPQQTRPQPFTSADGSRSNVAMMSRFATTMEFAETADATALMLPYQVAPHSGERIGMLVVLPRGDLASLEQQLTPAMALGWLDALRAQYVDVSIPKTTQRFHTSLAHVLSEMGMPTPFVDGGSFTNITPAELRLQDVLHETVLRIDERRTEAAAATAVIGTGIGLVNTPARPKFIADRPFLFFLVDEVRRRVLLMGHMVSSAQST